MLFKFQNKSKIGSWPEAGTTVVNKKNSYSDERSKEEPYDGKRRTQAERVALSDQRMFSAAMELISTQGAAQTTLKDICSQAGYSRGLATARFGSKEAFLQALLADFNKAWEACLAEHIGDKTGFNALLAANHALENFLETSADEMRGGYTIWYENIGGDNEIRRKLRSNHEIYRVDISRWLNEAVEAGELSDIEIEQVTNQYLTFVFGTIFIWLADSSFNLASHFGFFRSYLSSLVARSP